MGTLDADRDLIERILTEVRSDSVRLRRDRHANGFSIVPAITIC